VAARKQQDEGAIWIHIRLDFVDVRCGLHIIGDRGFPLTTGNFAAHLIG